jgi:hypothetical protein
MPITAPATTAQVAIDIKATVRVLMVSGFVPMRDKENAAIPIRPQPIPRFDCTNVLDARSNGIRIHALYFCKNL